MSECTLSKLMLKVIVEILMRNRVPNPICESSCKRDPNAR